MTHPDRRNSTAGAQFARFLVVGLLNTAFGQGVFALLVLAGLHHLVALLLATIAGVLFNFQTLGRLVFRDPDRRRLGRFIAGYAVIYAVNSIALDVLIRGGLEAIPAQLILTLPVALLSFAINRLLVFEASS